MLPFRTIVLEVTQACHHACVHCYNHWRGHRGRTVTASTLNRSEIRAMVRGIKRETALEQVAISGGEPLLRSDLPGILEDLADEGVGAAVITSGSLLTPARVERLPSGTLLEFTLFGADPELHDRIVGRRGTLKRVIEGVARARGRGCRLAVSVVVSALNAHDVRRALELGIALGAEGFLLNRINLSRATLAEAAMLVPSRQQIMQMLRDAEDVAVEYDAPISVSVPVPACMVDLAAYPHLHFGWCPRGGAEAYYTVSHDGGVRPCNHSSVVLGDLRQQSFRQIVTSAAARDFWAPVPVECRACEHPLRDRCLGGCPAASDECYGTGERWDPIIDSSLRQAAPVAPLQPGA
jgi:PqqA peptide cyclase